MPFLETGGAISIEFKLDRRHVLTCNFHLSRRPECRHIAPLSWDDIASRSEWFRSTVSTMNPRSLAPRNSSTATMWSSGNAIGRSRDSMCSPDRREGSRSLSFPRRDSGLASLRSQWKQGRHAPLSCPGRSAQRHFDGALQSRGPFHRDLAWCLLSPDSARTRQKRVHARLERAMRVCSASGTREQFARGATERRHRLRCGRPIAAAKLGVLCMSQNLKL